MTKPIIALAVAIMSIDKAYPVDLTAEVARVFPELAKRTFLRHAGRELTVADLLDNRTEFMWFTSDGKDFVNARNYSNEGFALAAAILEKSTGIPWPEFVRQQILQPLAMTNTFAGLTADEERRVSGQMAKSFSVSAEGPLADLREMRKYVRRDFRGIESLPISPSQASRATPQRKASPLTTAAGIVSTVSDLLIFYKFIDVFHLPEHRKSGFGQLSLSNLERGMLLADKVGDVDEVATGVAQDDDGPPPLGINHAERCRPDHIALRGSGRVAVLPCCDRVQELAHHVAASYLWDLYRYEESVCIGRYQLTHGIFATVSVDSSATMHKHTATHVDVDETQPEPCLVLRLYGSGYAYPLRVSRGASNDDGVEVKMKFASSMLELPPTGVGGSNQLIVKYFVVAFQRRGHGRFQGFV
ncbi:beta-lactamase/transpeptidase-like protein [Schizothecium vesticola]|uniref:Beta-lactamase/transpeptidase-like protein n=1 Tax=Schizothecium vesticola TaxID=314040 RepID=A0AA40ENX0_9PEZI|nr:beta-lactamase/transpeptidase-like protein [Schizothecium vesticola]